MNTSTQQSELTGEDVKSFLRKQRDYFASGATKSIKFRKEQLRKLKELIENNEDAIIEALHKDLRKHEFEAYTTEIGFVIVEIDKVLSKLHKWAKPEKVSTPPFLYVGSSQIRPEPYGTVLVIAPVSYTHLTLPTTPYV